MRVKKETRREVALVAKVVVVFEGMGERQHKSTCVRQGLGVIYRAGLTYLVVVVFEGMGERQHKGTNRRHHGCRQRLGGGTVVIGGFAVVAAVAATAAIVVVGGGGGGSGGGAWGPV